MLITDRVVTICPTHPVGLNAALESSVAGADKNGSLVIRLRSLYALQNQTGFSGAVGAGTRSEDYGTGGRHCR